MEISLRCTWMLLSVLCGWILQTNGNSVQVDLRSASALQVNQVLRHLYAKGEMVELRRMAEQVVQENNTKILSDSTYPSVFEYLGVAQYTLGDLKEATKTFERAVKMNADDAECWVFLGSCYLFQLKLPEAVAALEVGVLQKGSTKDMYALFKARSWMADWKDREHTLEQVQVQFEKSLQSGRGPAFNEFDFAELPSRMVKQLVQRGYGSNGQEKEQLCCDQNTDLRLKAPELRIGFVSSDFGVHPVSTLLRGILDLLSGAKHQTKVFCFSLSGAGSWWKRNISRTVDYMVSLTGKNTLDAAKIIQAHDIHVLVDLNGHTLHSGIDIFSHRPAPVQMAYLGYPMTIGNPGIDFFISDSISSPAETSQESFTEKLLLLPTHYIVNDHIQMLGHTLQGSRPSLSGIAGREKSTFVFATFSNWQKMDPATFSAWMEILARVPSSVMWFLEYTGHDGAKKNLRAEANARGIDGTKRLIFSELDPWIDHTYRKRAADLVLDTPLKNGHTTVLDAIFAGVPVVTLEGSRMSNRAGSSALHSLGLHDLTVNSLKEYVEVAVYLATHTRVLHKLRQRVEHNRLQYPLFDTTKYTAKFEEAIKVAWQVKKSRLQSGGAAQEMHIFPSIVSSAVIPRRIPVLSAKEDNHVEDEYETRIQKALAAHEPIRLHIGGHIVNRDWWIVDANDNDGVDFVMKIDNLYAFPDNSVNVIYSSHVLEHCSHGVGSELQMTLREWHRVLHPDGKLLVSVPNLFALATLFVNESIPHQHRVWIMNVIYGGQVDVYDMHKVGFDEAILAAYLEQAGFCNFTRYDDFRLFQDSSVLVVHHLPISINVMAHKCITT
ncbi:hypothetical protein PHYBOEH_005382 [Phytophthora boehmeriae]|uniref:UDP-N-acetylglucosamine-peptide N-acetylglucosaminyltransferase n=1 Tax=Phytophthora boehmeriae TaxID=109152 RepID=A0A8T1WQV8_9STRA|nr:hypothetical protein PHYBOEH_005382 [Phytophthora boehmeriae]